MEGVLEPRYIRPKYTFVYLGLFFMKNERTDMERRNFSMEEVVAYCNQYGFIF